MKTFYYDIILHGVFVPFINKHVIDTKTNLYCVLVCDLDNNNIMFASQINVLY